MPKTEFDGLPVIETDESEEITVAVKPEDIQEGDEKDPGEHPIATALRRQRGVDDARVSKREVMIRRGEKWFRYGAPKRVTYLFISGCSVTALPCFDSGTRG